MHQYRRGHRFESRSSLNFFIALQVRYTSCSLPSSKRIKLDWCIAHFSIPGDPNDTFLGHLPGSKNCIFVQSYVTFESPNNALF